MGLPKVLWQLEVKNLAITEIIIDILSFYIVQYGSKDTINNLQPLLVPLFFSKLTTEQGEKQIFGSFVNFPLSLQKKLIHIIYHFDTITDKLQLALLATCTAPNISVSTIKLIIELLINPDHISSQAERISFLLSILIGVCVDPFKEGRKQEKTSAELDEDRFLNISESISIAFTSYRLHSKLLELIEQQFLSVLNSPTLTKQTKTTLIHFLTHYCQTNKIELPSISPNLSHKIHTLLNTPIQ